VLIGDPRQLPEIEAGGAFAALTNTIGRVTLTTNRRQVEHWERDALADLRAGRATDALNAYRHMSGFTTARTPTRRWCRRGSRTAGREDPGP
jgi:ATP-dependent exoDNAse (exonuclease V) alpha subunit